MSVWQPPGQPQAPAAMPNGHREPFRAGGRRWKQEQMAAQLEQAQDVNDSPPTPRAAVPSKHNKIKPQAPLPPGPPPPSKASGSQRIPPMPSRPPPGSPAAEATRTTAINWLEAGIDENALLARLMEPEPPSAGPSGPPAPPVPEPLQQRSKFDHRAAGQGGRLTTVSALNIEGSSRQQALTPQQERVLAKVASSLTVVGCFFFSSSYKAKINVLFSGTLAGKAPSLNILSVGI